MGEGQEGSSDSPSNDSRFKTEEDIAMTEDFQLRPAGLGHQRREQPSRATLSWLSERAPWLLAP